MSYSDLLKDPRWQKKRLEILSRDNWQCQKCRSTIKTLHVHHKSYKKGRAPWEYDNDNFITYCEDCHGNHHKKNEPQKSMTDAEPVLIIEYDYQRGCETESYQNWCAARNIITKEEKLKSSLSSLQNIRKQFKTNTPVEKAEKQPVELKTGPKISALSEIRKKYNPLYRTNGATE